MTVPSRISACTGAGSTWRPTLAWPTRASAPIIAVVGGWIGSQPATLLRPSAAPGRGWHAHHLLEGAAEGRLGLVADLGRDGRDIGIAATQKLRSNLHPPIG